MTHTTYDARFDAFKQRHANATIVDIQCVQLRMRRRDNARDVFVIERIERRQKYAHDDVFFVETITMRNERTNERTTLNDDVVYDDFYVDMRDAQHVAFDFDIDVDDDMNCAHVSIFVRNARTR